VVSVRREVDDLGHLALLGPTGLEGVGGAAVARMKEYDADAAADDRFGRDVAQRNGHGAQPRALHVDGVVEVNGLAVNGNLAD
jgi:phage-related baseplate assembly protein